MILLCMWEFRCLFETKTSSLSIPTQRAGLARIGRMAGSWGIPIFNFLRNPYIVSTVAAPICILTTHVEGFLFFFFLHPDKTLGISFLLDNSHSSRWKITSHCGFHLHFFNVWWCQAPFHVPAGHFHVLVFCPLVK